MIYDIRHVTTYTYDAIVGSALCTMRLTPREGGGQHVIDSGIDMVPDAVNRMMRLDFFGNRVTTVRIETAHRELRVSALARVEVNRPAPPLAALTRPWEDVRADAFSARAMDALSPAQHLFPTRLVPLHEPATAYAAQSFTPGRAVLEGAADLMVRIKADFKYDPKATIISTPLAEAFEARGGVCQDFAHIMISGLRGLGLPAAYVSGYIRTVPPPGKKRLEGSDASHAWVAVWCGNDYGWLGLDPTNAIHVGDDHIELAVGRDYADVAPIAGIILGSGNQKLKVNVDVLPVNSPTTL